MPNIEEMQREAEREIDLLQARDNFLNDFFKLKGETAFELEQKQNECVDRLIARTAQKVREDERQKIHDDLNELFWEKDGALKMNDVANIVSSIMHYFISLTQDKEDLQAKS